MYVKDAPKLARRPKIDQACAKDPSRPALTMPWLAKLPKQRGYWIVSCDSYILAALPVEPDEGEKLEANIYIPAEAAKEWSKASAPDHLRLEDGKAMVGPSSWELPKDVGKPPDVGALLPEEVDVTSFQVGINAAFLWRLAQALGSETVSLEFTKGKGVETYEPSPLRPIRVRPTTLNGAGPVGLIMPVRLAG